MSIYVNQNYAQPTAHLHRYALRIDGFTSVHASYDGGEMITKPFYFTGDTLLLNFSTSAAGFIKVEILDLQGNKIEGYELENYIDKRCKNNLLFINIESQPAIDNLPELLSVPGLNGVIIGPHDLSCSMGLPEEYTNPIFEETVTKIIDECNKRNLGIGIHFSEEPEQQVKWARAGVNIILHSSDISLFGKILNHEISTIKTELEDDFDETEYHSTTI